MAVDWLTSEEVAAILGVKVGRVLMLRDLPCGKKHPQDARRRVWQRDAIEAYATQNGIRILDDIFSAEDERKILTFWNDLGKIRRHIGQQTHIGLSLARFYWNLTHPQTKGILHD